MKKVTMQDIADLLDVSRVTVWKVLNHKPGVSKSLSNQILSTAREVGYLKPGQDEKDFIEPNMNNSQKTISVIISRPKSSVFWVNIIHAVAKELDRHGINLMYTYLPPNFYKGYVLPGALTSGSVDGMLIMNVYNKELLVMINKLNIPKVYLDLVTDFPIETITGDLVLLEGESTVKKITDRIIKKGRTEIGFIGDVNYALTNKKRFDGFLAAMKENKLKVNPNYCLTGSIGIYTYYEEISAFLDNLNKMPQAFVCASDFIASFLMQYFMEHEFKVPNDIAMSGYDGSTEYSMVSGKLTTVQVQTSSLGKRLAQQLLYRIENTQSSIAVTHIYSKIIWGKSTDF